MPGRALKRRSIAARIASSYLAVLLLFAAASTWSVVAFRQAVSEAGLLRRGYLPVALNLRDLISNQDSWNSQLNHVTTARNPADARLWFETNLSAGRPQKLSALRAALARLPSAGTKTAERLEHGLGQVERLMARDAPQVRVLFVALAQGDVVAAQKTRDDLVRQGIHLQSSLSDLEELLSDHIDQLVDVAQRRERMALSILVALIFVSLLVGILMAGYARRLLQPLTRVTERASAVAAGDLSAQPAIQSDDEIGELSETFETMVGAIADARQRLVAAERLAAMGRMAAHVTHEIRNPLSSIALNLDLLEEELKGDQAEARELSQSIGQEVARLSRLSDQYLSMARRRSPDWQSTDVGDLLRRAVEFATPELSEHGVAIDLLVPSDLPAIDLDQGQIRQVVYNLLRNAREAMPEGGTVSIAVDFDEQTVSIRVADTGPGVPEEEVAQLFDPFYTTKSHGTGLGLAVSRQVILAHGGSLDVSKNVPQGAAFRITLQRVHPRSLPDGAPAPPVG